MQAVLVRTCVTVGVLGTISSGDSHFLKSSRPLVAKEIEETLRNELVGIPLISHGTSHVESFETLLRPIFNALPKDDRGLLGHTESRYALHRLFMQLYSWHVRGLEPGASVSDSGSPAPQWNLSLDSVSVWPSFLQDNLEQLRGGTGLSLRDVAALGATLEDLVHQDTADRLGKIYDMLDFRTDIMLQHGDVAKVIDGYFVLFEKAMYMKNNMTKESLAEKEQRAFSSRRFGQLIAPWLRDLEMEVAKREGANLDHASFDLVTSIASEVGKRFRDIRVLECRTMKQAFISMERKPGRIRLSDFYNKSRSSKWELSESVSYLRALGTLDETNASNILVISTNYITAMPQCLQASSLYSICCPDECEALLSNLEGSIQGPTAAPALIAQLVAGLGTNTVAAPRKLSDKLVGRLGFIATANGGSVPIHGRLFAQWMHHAFPRECPFPQKMGESKLMTPDEWMKATGSADSRSSADEMDRHIRVDDTCSLVEGPGRGHSCDDDADDLPWSSSEELLRPIAPQHHPLLRLSATHVAACLAILAALVRSHNIVRGPPGEHGKRLGRSDLVV